MHQFERDYSTDVVPEFESFEAFLKHQGSEVSKEQAMIFVEDGRLLLKRIMNATNAGHNDIPFLGLPLEFTPDYILTCLHWLNIYHAINNNQATHKGMYVMDLGSKAANDMLHVVMTGGKGAEKTWFSATALGKARSAVGIVGNILGYSAVIRPVLKKAKAVSSGDERDVKEVYTRVSSHFNKKTANNTKHLGQDCKRYAYPYANGQDPLQTSLVIKLQDGRVALKPETHGADFVDAPVEAGGHSVHFVHGIIHGKPDTKNKIGRREDAVDESVLDLVKQYINQYAGKGFKSTKKVINDPEKSKAKIRDVITNKLGYHQDILKHMKESLEKLKELNENAPISQVDGLSTLIHDFETALRDKYGVHWEQQYGREVSLFYRDEDIKETYFNDAVGIIPLLACEVEELLIPEGVSKPVRDFIVEFDKTLKHDELLIRQMKEGEEKDKSVEILAEKKQRLANIKTAVIPENEGQSNNAKSLAIQGLILCVEHLSRDRKRQKTTKTLRRIENIIDCMQNILSESSGENLNDKIVAHLVKAIETDKQQNFGSKYTPHETKVMLTCQKIIKEVKNKNISLNKKNMKSTLRDLNVLMSRDQGLADNEYVVISGDQAHSGKVRDDGYVSELDSESDNDTDSKDSEDMSYSSGSDRSESDTDSDDSIQHVTTPVAAKINSPVQCSPYDTDLTSRILRNNIDFLMALHMLESNKDLKFLQYNSSGNELIHTIAELGDRYYVSTPGDALFQNDHFPNKQQVVKSIEKQIALYLGDKNPVVGIHKRYADLQSALFKREFDTAQTIAEDLHAKTAPKSKYLAKRLIETDKQIAVNDFPDGIKNSLGKTAINKDNNTAFMQLKHDYTPTGREEEPSVELIKLNNAEVKQEAMIEWFNQVDRTFKYQGTDLIIKAEVVPNPFGAGSTIGFFKLDGQVQKPLDMLEAKAIGSSVMASIKTYLDTKVQQHTMTAESNRKNLKP